MHAVKSQHSFKQSVPMIEKPTYLTARRFDYGMLFFVYFVFRVVLRLFIHQVFQVCLGA